MFKQLKKNNYSHNNKRKRKNFCIEKLDYQKELKKLQKELNKRKQMN